MDTTAKHRDRNARDVRRIGDLEDELKAANKRISELKAERDAVGKTISAMIEQVQDARDQIDQWIEAFHMTQNEKGEYDLTEYHKALDQTIDKYENLRTRWNRFVGEYNATVAPVRRNFGRPIAAGPAQQDEVRKLRAAGHSLRDIAEEKNLSVRTVRTIVDKKTRTDRGTMARLERILPDKFQAAKERLGKRMRA
jgi:DNA repair exonuclease SbcCD ATPase subunit